MDTSQIQDISDDGTCLAGLGRPEAARLLQTAPVAEANARQGAEQARIRAEGQVAISNRALHLKQADRDQAILGQGKVAVRQAALKQRQLDTEVRKPADAERYRVEQEAEGRRNSGNSTAEAEAMQQRADAFSHYFSHYNEAAVLGLFVKILPGVARELASPMASIDSLTVLSTDGATALPRQVTENLARTMQMLEGATGVDIQQLLQRATATVGPPRTSGSVDGGSFPSAAGGPEPSRQG